MEETAGKTPRSRDLERIIAATQDFERQRLTLAREMAGLDIKELAERIEMTSSAVSQFEKGHTRPRAETVIRLALALGVPPEYFAGDPMPPIRIDGCHFRSLRSATMKERRRVLAHGTVLKGVVDHLRTMVNFPEEQLSQLEERLSAVENAEELSTAVRDAWNLGYGPISDMVGLLEAKGILPVEVPGHSGRLDAFSAWVDDQPVVFLTPDKSSGSRRRFDAAHELLHLLKHRDVEPGNAQAEKEADAFASAFLLPQVPFVAECPRRLTWGRLREMKKRWGVSLAAIVRRAFDLGIYSEATYRRAYVYLNKSGWRTQEPDEPPMEHPTLVQRAVGLLREAGYPLTRLAEDLSLGEGMLEALLMPPREQQVSLAFQPE